MPTQKQRTSYGSGSQNGWNRSLGGDFERQEGEQSKGGDRGAKQHKGGENANHVCSVVSHIIFL